MRTRRNILVILSIGIILIVSIFFTFNKSEEYKELPKVKMKDTVDKKQFALMLEQDNGEYQKSDDELPTEGYVFNESKSGCIDTNGQKLENIINYDYENYTMVLNTNKTSYCYLYYDIEPNIKYLRSKDTESHISKELTGGMYRYQGLYTDDIRNYICLGEICCNTGECSADTNDNMYRIIGINAKGELKVIKKTALTEALQWHTVLESDTEWPDSDLFHRLNDNEKGTYKDNSFYNGLNQNLKSIIIKKDWLYGDYNAANYNGDVLYDIENGIINSTHVVKENDGNVTKNYKWNNNINASIGLMYIYDYLYTYKTSNLDAGNPGNYSNAINSWIHISHNEIGYPINNQSERKGYEWLITRYGYHLATTSYRMFSRAIGIGGDYGDEYITFKEIVRPVFYLSNEVDLEGEGSLNSPFKIKNLDVY